MSPTSDPLKGHVLLGRRGVYTYAKICIINQQIYAENGTNRFIRLKRGGATSQDGVFWAELPTTPKMIHDVHGNMILDQKPSFKSMEEEFSKLPGVVKHAG